MGLGTCFGRAWSEASGSSQKEFWIHEKGQAKDEICLEQTVVQGR